MKEEVKAMVGEMIRDQGVYVCGDSEIPDAIVVIVSMGGKLYSTVLDRELNPDRFLDTLVLRGRYLA
jgi:hypothetical protein